MPESSKAGLIGAIREAFAWRTRPGVLTDSDELTPDEWEELLAIGKQCRYDVTGDDWEKYFDAIHWFSPEAFCYYLPGVLTVSIKEDAPRLLVVDSVIYPLNRSPTPEWWDDSFLARWPLLTERECDVVQEWIWWLAYHESRPFDDESLTCALHTIELLKRHGRGAAGGNV